MVQAFEVRSMLPAADVYVMEDKPWTTGRQTFTPLSLNIMKFQVSLIQNNKKVGDGILSADRLSLGLPPSSQVMLSTLLSRELNAEPTEHNMFYIPSRAINKLFRILVGGERVSSQYTVRDMMERCVANEILSKLSGTARSSIEIICFVWFFTDLKIDVPCRNLETIFRSTRRHTNRRTVQKWTACSRRTVCCAGQMWT